MVPRIVSTLSATLLFGLTTPLAAQIEFIDIEFLDSGCEPCTASLKSRLERVRGVEQATVDAERGVLRLRLSADNRVRLGPLRARVEQDGTRITALRITATGTVERSDGTPAFRPAGSPERFRVVSAAGVEFAAGETDLRARLDLEADSPTLVVEPDR